MRMVRFFSNAPYFYMKIKGNFDLRYLNLTSLSEAVEELKKVGVDPYGIEAMAPKMMNVNILIEDVECKVANIIKQEMLSIGGDAAVARGSVGCSIDKTDAILIGTIKQIRRFADKISSQPFGLSRIGSDIRKLFDDMSRNSFAIRTPEREIIKGLSVIHGTGIDLVEIPRIEKILKRWDEKFTDRVYSKSEIEYCRKHAHPAIHYAARFAAKEAFLKGMGTGLTGGLRLKDIEVVSDQQGKPVLNLHNHAKAALNHHGIEAVHLSISHTNTYAVAVVVLERKVQN